MPIKIGKSQVIVNRETKKKTVSHDYVKTKSKQELIELYNKMGQLPKRKQKIKNELVRRGGVQFVCPTVNGNEDN
jgi:predicted flavoprotein YhiN